MTTIAWDGTTLAADKQITWGGTPIVTTKLHRARSTEGHRVIFGCAGKSFEIQAFVDWLKGFRNMPVLTEIDFLCVDASGQVWCANQALQWLPVHSKQWAIGSGADYALGAMAAGVNAVQAIKIASRLDVDTGLGVNSLRF